MTGNTRIGLRRARREDSALLLAWRNDPQTHRWFLHPARVARDAHAAWFDRQLADAGSRIYIAESAKQPVGQLRLERRGAGVAEVSFSVDRHHRGRGVGTVLLKRAAAAGRRDLGVSRLIAYVKPDNVASAIAFLKAGYRFTGIKPRAGQRTYAFELTIA